MRFDAMGCAGNPSVKTPNLDELAGGGVLFSNAFAQNAVCQPSRASIITGQYPHAHGVRDNCFRLSPNIETLPGLLGKAGYRTVSVGKMHFEPFDALYGFESRRIAEDKSGGYDDHYRRYLSEKGLRHLSPDVMWKERTMEALVGMTSPLSEEDYIDSWCGRETIQEIRRNDDRPFFIWTGFPSPHVPTDPPKPWVDMYPEDEIKEPPVHPEEWGNKPPEMKQGVYVEKEQIRRFIAHYYAMVSLIDRWVGEIVDCLQETGQYDNTLIIFSTDHGDYAGWHGKIAKGVCLYEDLIHVPFIMHWPDRLDAGSESTAQVELVDILPTVLDYAGADIPWGIQGFSLRPVLEEGKASVRDFAFAEYFYQKAVRTPDWKLIYYAGKPYGELFDMRNDPHEWVNRYDDPSLQEIREDLTRRLLDFLVATENPLPKPGDYWFSHVKQNSAYRPLKEPHRGSL
jgi:arylsulfatase